ncbi:MAG: TMEM165/GDT1 family protein [Halobacteriaceae archaeon]
MLESAPINSLSAVIERYDSLGPLAAAFLANLLATFGDKGQLVVITLASKYDAKRVFIGSMGAFTLWSALEVIFGAWIKRVLPGDIITILTGSLFIIFGLWTFKQVLESIRVTRISRFFSPFHTISNGGTVKPIDATVLPPWAQRFAGQSAVLTSFVFIMFAEFGDKTQLLTINLAATFPNAPVSVFIGVVAALGLRTGIDAVIGEQVERALPTRYIQLVAGLIFIAFGLLVFNIISATMLLIFTGITLAAVIVGWVYQLISRSNT